MAQPSPITASKKEEPDARELSVEDSAALTKLLSKPTLQLGVDGSKNSGPGALVWGELTLPEGTNLKMRYRGEDHFAIVSGGKIVDHGETYSPSEWARKVARDTSRNAWRDIWIKGQDGTGWILADQLRRDILR